MRKGSSRPFMYISQRDLASAKSFFKHCLLSMLAPFKAIETTSDIEEPLGFYIRFTKEFIFQLWSWSSRQLSLTKGSPYHNLF